MNDDSDTDRPMTLAEWCARLPDDHRVNREYSSLLHALDTIAHGMTNNFPGAPDVMQMTPEEFRSGMWTWSQKVAADTLTKLNDPGRPVPPHGSGP